MGRPAQEVRTCQTFLHQMPTLFYSSQVEITTFTVTKPPFTKDGFKEHLLEVIVDCNLVCI